MSDSFLAMAAARAADAPTSVDTSSLFYYDVSEADAAPIRQHEFATMCFFHCSGRLSCKRCDIDSIFSIMLDAREYVLKQVGGAPFSLIRASTMEPLHERSEPVSPGEMLIVVLRGK